RRGFHVTGVQTCALPILRAAGPARIRKTIAKRSPRLADKVTAAVIDALGSQTLTLPAESTWGQVIAELAADLDRVHARRAELARSEERRVGREWTTAGSR